MHLDSSAGDRRSGGRLVRRAFFTARAFLRERGGTRHGYCPTTSAPDSPRCARNWKRSRRNRRWRFPRPSSFKKGAPPARSTRDFMTPRSTSAAIRRISARPCRADFPQIPGGRQSTADSRRQRPAGTGQLADPPRSSAHGAGAWSTASGSTISASGWCGHRRISASGASDPAIRTCSIIWPVGLSRRVGRSRRCTG